MSGTFGKGFETQPEQVTIARLPLYGDCPSWLNGMLLRNGPGQFETRHAPIEHWFDGLAMLVKFGFQAGQISYTNRYLDTQVRQEAERTGQISYVGFAAGPPRSVLKRLARLVVPHMTDNANVNITQIDGQFVAMTELPVLTAFDPYSLVTLGRFPLDDRLSGQVTTAHPHWNSALNAELNFLTQFGVTHRYHLFAIARGQRKRRVIATIPTRQVAYMHSFGMTEHYAILTEFPLVFNFGAILRGESGINSLEWQPEHGTRFQVIRLSDGQWLGTFESDPVFAFHHVNAYEQGDTLIIDFPAFPNADFIKTSMGLSDLRVVSPEQYPTVTFPLRRYRVSLASRSVSYETVSTHSIELPRFNDTTHNGLPYRYTYGVGVNPQVSDGAPNQLVKIDTDIGREWTWYHDDCYPGEPVFVPRPNATAEDDGVILSLMLDGTCGTSFLSIIDAASFVEIGRAELPHHVPFGFHGQFYPDADQRLTGTE